MTPIAELKSALASMDAGVMYSAKDLRAVVEPAVADLEGQIAAISALWKQYNNSFMPKQDFEKKLGEMLANTHEAATAYLAQVRRQERNEQRKRDAEIVRTCEPSIKPQQVNNLETLTPARAWRDGYIQCGYDVMPAILAQLEADKP